MNHFRTEDVITLAKAIIEDAVLYEDNDYDWGFYCEYCVSRTGNSYPTKETFQHAIDCPVLVAKDVLTGWVDPPERKETERS